MKFLKLFDGPQNFFWCSLLILTFSKFIWRFKWIWAENVHSGHQEELRKIRDLSSKSNPLNYMATNGSKNPKNLFLMHFVSITRVSDLSDGVQDTPLRRFFFSSLYLSDCIFFKDILDDLMRTFFLNKCCDGNRKKTFFQLS